MGLHYTHQITQPLIGSKADDGTRTAVALTGSYGTPAKIKTAGFSKLNLDILYTMGAAESGNSIELQIEASPDGTNWYRIPNDETSGGTSTLTAREFTFVGEDAAAATISIGLDIFYEWVRVSAKETGSAGNNGTAYIEATLSGK